MIIVDDRKGSKEFCRLLTRAGATAVVKRLPFADFKVIGHGPHGSVRVGIERKTISEIVSAFGDNRFIGHQLPGLLGTRTDGTRRYDYVFIVLEGDQYLEARTGLLNPKSLRHLPQKAHLYRTVKKFELTLMLKAGLRIIPTQNKQQTVEVILAISEWFAKRWSAHGSAYAVEENKPDAAILADRTMKRKVANQLTQLAWKRTVKADAYFPSIVSMMVGRPDFKASPEGLRQARHHWQRALGIVKGTKMAEGIVEICHRRDDVKAKGR